jgi:hypothetical protein
MGFSRYYRKSPVNAGKPPNVEPALNRGLDGPPPVVTPPPPGEDDPLNAARGIMNGILYSIPIWFLIGFVGYLCFRGGRL